ncbi:hypothetical protein AXF42_Ash003256 [Apostasia shenzhenica]|uniref:DUF4218 domain-containing protein n=1 Tax=Apostasia shenzhenica TaxID=1088818 RepID=A0A2I0BFN3_9ASPA|nr:hypothetical protein AXF42_Ash003256 [Apostasia shenzhenica]
MHIEKNIYKSIIGILLNAIGKSKDSINARLDMVSMGIRQQLAPKVYGSRTCLPHACYTFTKEEKKRFCKVLYELKVSDGYSSNLKSHVNLRELKLINLKSHDCYLLMQQLLPVAIRGSLDAKLQSAITRLCFFFNSLCAKTIDPLKLDALQVCIIETICELEMFFPPSFFNIMVHLTVHLVREVQHVNAGTFVYFA